MKFSIRLLYLYLFSFIGLIISIIGTVQLVDLGMKVFVFKEADKYDYPMAVKFDPSGKEIALSEKEKEEQKLIQENETKRNRQRQISTALSMILVGFPLYKYHWKLIKREDKG